MNYNPISIFWVKKDYVAGSRLPSGQADIGVLYNSGIRRIVSAESAKEVKSMIARSGYGLEHLPLPIPDFGVPTEGQVKEFILFLRESLPDSPTLVHCYAGCGRTGVLLMIYLMCFENLPFDRALANLRSVRPCAVETPKQQEFLENLDVEALRSLARDGHRGGLQRFFRL